MVALGGWAFSYERGAPVHLVQTCKTNLELEAGVLDAPLFLLLLLYDYRA